MSVAIKSARMATQGGLYGNVQGGGLFSSLKKIVGGIGRVGISALTGGPLAAASTAISQFRPSPSPTGSASAAVMPAIGKLMPVAMPAPMPAPYQQQIPLPGPVAAIQRFVPGGATGYATTAGVACPSGYHPNKTGYFTRSGYVAPKSKCVRNRRRNPLNPRALDRSMGRIASAGKALKKLGFKPPAVRKIAATGKKRAR